MLKDEWRKFPSRNLPRNFNYSHVYHYLIESVSDVYVDLSVTKESDDEDECSESQRTVTSKPLDKEVHLLKSEFVHDSQDNMDTNGQYYMEQMSTIQHCVKCVQIRSYFWSVFSCIRTEYGDLLRKSPYSVRRQENTS